MVNIYDVEASELIEKAAEEMKNVEAVSPPEWAPFVKTGVHKERAPARDDWWEIRAASVLRKIYRQGPIGVSKLRMKYGGKKNRGHKTEHTYKGSGNIIRKVLQQLEKAGFVKQADVSGHKGRVITAEGKKFLDSVAGKLAKDAPKPQAVKKEEKKAEAKPEVKQEAEQKASSEASSEQSPKKEEAKETPQAEDKQ